MKTLNNELRYISEQSNYLKDGINTGTLDDREYIKASLTDIKERVNNILNEMERPVD